MATVSGRKGASDSPIVPLALRSSDGFEGRPATGTGVIISLGGYSNRLVQSQRYASRCRIDDPVVCKQTRDRSLKAATAYALQRFERRVRPTCIFVLGPRGPNDAGEPQREYDD